MHTETIVVLLFAVAAGVALVARWLNLPYTVALVVAGLLLGGTTRVPVPDLSKELVFTVFLPGLLFEAAFHVNAKRFWQNKIAIFSLALPGVVVAVVVTALTLTPLVEALHFVDRFPLALSFVFASLLAATDPIAVVGLFKSLGAPRRLAILVEGESLINDGTSIVVFSLVLAAALGGNTTLGSALLTFLQVVGIGAVVGLAVSYGISKIIQRVDESMVEITLTTVAAYGSFVLAEQVHASGVIATVVAGMVCGNYAATTGMSPTTRLAVESFWEYVAFALNSVIFLLIGFHVHIDELLASWRPIVVAYVAVTLGRLVVVWIVSLALHRTSERMPWSWPWVLTWGGLRGGLSMVLSLSLPADMPHRSLLITMTFGVVVLSILAQGLTMAPLLRRLGLVGRGGGTPVALEEGRVLAARAAAATLPAVARELRLDESAYHVLHGEYEERERAAEDSLRALRGRSAPTADERVVQARRRLLHAEKTALRHGLEEGKLAADVYERLARDVDARLLALEDGAGEHEAESAA